MSDSTAAPWSVAHQVSLSMGFSRQEYWSRMSFPSEEDIPNPGIESSSAALQADSLPLSQLFIVFNSDKYGMIFRKHK